MKTKKQILGEFGENLAVWFFEKKGYIVLARNVKTGYNEIDIVAKQGGITVFIEVKTRASERYGLAIDAMGRQKQKNFKRAIMFFCRKDKIDFNFIRADFLAIQLDKIRKTARINHLKDIV